MITALWPADSSRSTSLTTSRCLLQNIHLNAVVGKHQDKLELETACLTENPDIRQTTFKGKKHQTNFRYTARSNLYAKDAGFHSLQSSAPHE